MIFLLQTNVDRRDDKHFEDGSGPSHGKRHRQRVSPHRYLENGEGLKNGCHKIHLFRNFIQNRVHERNCMFL